MKKFAILALAALLVVAFTVPATALENEFGGYWRTRFYNQGQFNGSSDIDNNLRVVDTRTHLYYTAKINDNLKFVNKFEFDTTWGSSRGSRDGSSVDAAGDSSNFGYGEVGADGGNVEIKNSYADFNLGPVNLTVGVQPYALFREFHISTDASGIIGRWKVLDNFVLAGSWLKAFDGGGGTGNNEDVDAYTLTGAFWFSENMSIKPSISYIHSSDAATYANAELGGSPLIGNQISLAAIGVPGIDDQLDLWTYGFDFDASFDNFGIWFTAYGQTGTLDTSGGDVDFKGWLAAVGGNVALGPVDLHGQVIYTPGDDDSDDELEQIYSPQGSYYWSEIMGLGTFDNAASAGSTADTIDNLMAFNIGATMKPMDKLKVTVDLWYAQLEEDEFAPGQEDELGTELDVKVTYELVEGLNLDLIGAYLWAGDATSLDGNNQEDPYEFGARLSLSF
ncbi:MAG: hypothetical protein V2I56_12495 [Desulfobacteraceae bacterium]|jgi:hypothetical protein|nr:hypothetical protein [Desulfobacteraceae bacterium]